ncbi:uncharacterized protein BX663DRAFT_543373 [Cokeromyces recurvatus]|uniref:uncharacterized protein n=1 Tax=Cokeromyces recurvatus TaxID=90255 RepID=UPI00221EACF5|nr:uncharacterized protein BX663DRAFT_543373 [Cokeromyces recurvatus]KAI7902363.1 hypothetical protein BX663DRAFT_543373 [Cokeromyces recurvatus]
MSQQIGSNDHNLSLDSLEPTSTVTNNTNRLPLRKRISPILKWQPVETPEEHNKPKTYPQTYPLQQQDIIKTDTNKQTYNEIKHFNEKRTVEKEELNQPVKKIKRGRPPLQKNSSTDTKSDVNEPLPNVMSTEPSTKLYCICKRPYDVPRFMIACDKCNEWFHGECIQISEKQGEFIDLYFCDNCSKITGKKTSWKPKCANPACSKAARIGTHQGHLSKYCTDNCGMQVARARIELAELKKRNATMSLNKQHYNPLSRSKLSSFAELDDRARLCRVKEEKIHAKDIIQMVEQKSKLLNMLIQKEDNNTLCGFDSRLSWPDTLWEKVHYVIEKDEVISLLDENEQPLTTAKVFHVCQQNRKSCNRHTNWQKLKTAELEQERSEQFVILTMLERERQQIKARMKKRREEVDLVEFLENGTITHY